MRPDSRRPPGDRLISAALGVAALVVLSGSGPASAKGAGREPAQAGSYCALPEPGEVSACLDPAKSEFSEFFAALESGEVGAEDAAPVEDALDDRRNDERAYRALSSLVYAYWQILVMLEARAESLEPGVAAGLDRWNAVLASAYERSEDRPAFHEAVRQAADDLVRRAPERGLRCADISGGPIRCRPTAGLVATLDRIDDQLGVRGAIRRVLRGVVEAAEP